MKSVEEYIRLSETKTELTLDDVVYVFELQIEEYGTDWFKRCFVDYTTSFYEESIGNRYNRYIILERPSSSRKGDLEDKIVSFPFGSVYVLFRPEDSILVFVNQVHEPCGILIPNNRDDIWRRLDDGWIMQVKEGPYFSWFLRVHKEFFTRFYINRATGRAEYWVYEIVKPEIS